MKTFAEHLQELKMRIFISLGMLGFGSLIGFMIHKPLEYILQKPLGQTLYYSNPAGGLSFVVQIALGLGVVIALPVVIYQTVQFLRPAIKPVKNRHIILLIVSAVALTVLAIIYTYFVSLPSALHFLTTFNSSGVKALISVSDYLKFVIAYMMGTVIAFQIPLIMYFTNKIRRFPPGGLLKLQRPAVIGAIIFAGVITPTVDPMNQLMVALPIIILFEIGAISVVVANKFNKPLPHFEIKKPAVITPIIIPLPSSPSPIKVIFEGQPVKIETHVIKKVDSRPLFRSNMQFTNGMIVDILAPPAPTV